MSNKKIKLSKEELISALAAITSDRERVRTAYRLDRVAENESEIKIGDAVYASILNEVKAKAQEMLTEEIASMEEKYREEVMKNKKLQYKVMKRITGLEADVKNTKKENKAIMRNQSAIKSDIKNIKQIVKEIARFFHAPANGVSLKKLKKGLRRLNDDTSFKKGAKALTDRKGLYIDADYREV